MKTKFRLEELQEFAYNISELYDQVCTDIEGKFESEFEIEDEDREDEIKESIISYLAQYMWPWNSYDDRHNALMWLEDHGYIEKEND